jgi:folate-binding protein YgfZ
MSFTGRLAQRSVLRVSGAEVHQYLHGLFTNDVLGLLPERRSLYGCFLDTNGRTLYDAFLLHQDTPVDGRPAVLVDVHGPCAAEVAEHLLEYRLRRKIKVENLANEMAVMVQTAASSSSSLPGGEMQSGFAGNGANMVYDDPRNIAFGGKALQRLYVPSMLAARSWNPPEYERLLLASGVGEGPATFVKDKTLPFEGNIDMLGAVSFHKGCYIGQELTHRTHVMLVTRKRTVPIVLDPECATIGWGKPGDGIFVESTRVGHVQHSFESLAVGLLRLRYMNKTSRSCRIRLENGSTGTASIPPWWDPEEVTKILQNQD